jgi:hypothetical protein
MITVDIYVGVLVIYKYLMKVLQSIWFLCASVNEGGTMKNFCLQYLRSSWLDDLIDKSS